MGDPAVPERGACRHRSAAAPGDPQVSPGWTDAAMPVAPGALTVTERVTVVFALDQ
ncbi:hypothetical protein [Mangrovicoccus ximenensis]|uniref:hypothetical protein n=1 Tax=Mangrovicoccus ximenensis TaxID=1911570 RepID=UPI0013749F82|nr:hypothetical protein [Mangrovicoccus ximenensis]